MRSASILKFGTVAAIFSYFAACAPVKFEQIPEPSCGGNGVVCAKTCSGNSCSQTYSITKTVGQTPVDILMVDDNSGSMSPLQNKFASAFNGFIQNLDTAGLDYRIAMTTTDISNTYSQMEGPELISRDNGPKAINGNGALQDGSLIDLGNGSKFITPADSNRVSLFASSVKRNETITCEQSGYSNCPSDDERGVFALNLMLDRSADQFLRSDAALAVIILSNEDERGLSWMDPSTDASAMQIKSLYPAKSYDKPETFVSRFRAKFPGKTLAVHSIVVKPGDVQCKNQLSIPTQYILAKEGYVYSDLSQRTNGTVGSICDSSYTNQLQVIGNNIQSQALALPFSCRPDGDHYTVTMSPQPVQNVTWTPNWTAMTLTTAQTLPAGTSVTLSYTCSQAN